MENLIGGVKEIEGPITFISETIPNLRVKGKLYLSDDKIDKLALTGELAYENINVSNAKIIGSVLGMTGHFYNINLIGSMTSTKSTIIDGTIKGKFNVKNFSGISEINITDGPIKIADSKINKLITNSRKIEIIDSSIGYLHILNPLTDLSTEPFKIFISGKSIITEIMATGPNIVVKTIGFDVQILRPINVEIKQMRIEKPNYIKVVGY